MTKTKWKKMLVLWTHVVNDPKIVDIDIDTPVWHNISVGRIKEKYVEGYLYFSCYFCAESPSMCWKCPGILVDPDFHCNRTGDNTKPYAWHTYPKRFLDKLCELYVINFQESIVVNGYEYYLE